jgi:dTDP-L-rhamnose 4-epimerase
MFLLLRLGYSTSLIGEASRRLGSYERLAMRSLLVTGGAGFIGSHLVDELLEHGYRVRVLDSLVGQVHGGSGPPEFLDRDAEFQEGDVRDHVAVRRALDGVDGVVHLAARVGVGQSMYEIAEYANVNSFGTAVLLQELLDRPVQKLVVASSMSIYGEGETEPVPAVERTRGDLERRRFEPRGQSGEELTAVPTRETKQAENSSVYALTKYDQERLCLLFGSAYSVPTVALRFFNVYGPRQALSNPYTGVLAIFASRLLNGRPPLVYEDGEQRRDFVSVHDVTRACRLALEGDGADGLPVNIGSGESVTVLEIGQRLADILGLDIEPKVTGQYRAGDIRHCFADVSRARKLLGFEPLVDLQSGMRELAEWLTTQRAEDHFEHASAELVSRRLAR